MTRPHRRVLAVETRGIEPVPDAERHGGPAGLFWTWCGANMGVLGITLGAILVTVLGLDVLQAAVVAVVGSGLSFALVGLLSVAGVRGGAPGLTLSRAVFGVRGNRAPTLVAWLGFVGWETVICTTAAFALLALLDLGGVPATGMTTAVCVLATVVLAAVIGLFGHATILWVQKWLTWVFGALTLLVVGLLLVRTDWSVVARTEPAPAAAVVGGIALIAAGTGLGWLAAGADYARYLPRTTSSRSVVVATVGGATLPLLVLITTGALMATGDPALAGAGDPVAAIAASLPPWVLAPYLLAAVAGLVAAADLSMYSSGLVLITGGVPVRRTTAVVVDAVLITGGALAITLVAQDFVGPFTTFLSLLAVPLTAWAATFAVDLVRRTARGGSYDPTGLMDATPAGPYWFTGGVRLGSLGAWAGGIAAGLAFTTVTLGERVVYTGWFGETWLGRNGMAWFVAGAVAALVATLASRPVAAPAEPVARSAT